MNDYEKYTIDQIDYNIKRVNEILNGKFNDFTREIDTLYICCKKLDDLVKTYLAKGGTITKLPPALAKGMKPSDMVKHKVGLKGVVKEYRLKEVRDFIGLYNLHFLTNYAAEEFIVRNRLEG